jgi:hypothetical protein
MPRKRATKPDKSAGRKVAQDNNVVKYSVLLPQATNDRLQAIASRRGVSLADVTREMIHLSLALEDKTGSVLCVEFDTLAMKALAEAASLLSTSREAVIQQLVVRQLADVLIEARQTAKKLEEAMRPEGKR